MVFRHTSLYLNRWSHRSFEIILHYLEPASTQTSYPNTFWIPVCATHKPKMFLWRCCALLERCKHNPQPKNLHNLRTSQHSVNTNRYAEYVPHLNGYHSWCLYTQGRRETWTRGGNGPPLDCFFFFFKLIYT